MLKRELDVEGILLSIVAEPVVIIILYRKSFIGNANEKC
jgi:hypothetical protein